MINSMDSDTKKAESLNEGDIIEMPHGLVQITEINQSNNDTIEIVFTASNGDIGSFITYPEDEFEIFPTSEFRTHNDYESLNEY